MEECNELSQRASKAIRFGLEEVQEGQKLNNTERMINEFNDLMAVVEMMDDLNIMPVPHRLQYRIAKKRKIRKWIKYSQDLKIVQ